MFIKVESSLYRTYFSHNKMLTHSKDCSLKYMESLQYVCVWNPLGYYILYILCVWQTFC